MTDHLRRLVAVLALLATVFTAGAVGAARGQAVAVGEIVICADGAAVTIAVDAEGNPVAAPHWCPDCVMSLLAGLPAGPALAAPPARGALLLAGPVRAWRAAGPAPVPPARGPPVA